MSSPKANLEVEVEVEVAEGGAAAGAAAGGYVHLCSGAPHAASCQSSTQASWEVGCNCQPIPYMPRI